MELQNQVTPFPHSAPASGHMGNPTWSTSHSSCRPLPCLRQFLREQLAVSFSLIWQWYLMIVKRMGHAHVFCHTMENTLRTFYKTDLFFAAFPILSTLLCAWLQQINIWWINSFHRYLLSAYYMLGIIRSTGDRVGHKTDKILALLELRWAKQC